MTLKEELAIVLNRHSRENESNTPDFIMAHYLTLSLIAAEMMINQREKWYGIFHKPGQSDAAPSQAKKTGRMCSCIECVPDVAPAPQKCGPMCREGRHEPGCPAPKAQAIKCHVCLGTGWVRNIGVPDKEGWQNIVPAQPETKVPQTPEEIAEKIIGTQCYCDNILGEECRWCNYRRKIIDALRAERQAGKEPK